MINENKESQPKKEEVPTKKEDPYPFLKEKPEGIEGTKIFFK